jgi:hypothetical protein
MKKLLSVILFSSSLLLGQSNNNKVDLDSIKHDYKKFISPSKVEIIKTPEQQFWKRNEGTILGALLAGLVSIFTVGLAHYYSKSRTKHHNREIYYGLLAVLKSELEYQSKTIKLLIEEIKVTGDSLRDGNELGLKKTFRKIQTKFIYEARNKLLSIEIKDTDLLRLLTSFINKCELINDDLNYEVIYIFYKNAKDNNQSDEFVSIFFGDMQNHTVDTLSTVNPIISFIESELEKNKIAT